MKRIRKGALGAVLMAGGTIVAFLGMAKPARTAPASAAMTRSSSTMPTSENAYCAKGDIWTGATSDGPARLPEGCVYTGLDGSPSPGKVAFLAAGGDVVSSVKAASCGDTIQLQQGATFTLKSPVFPSRIAILSIGSRSGPALQIPRCRQSTQESIQAMPESRA